MTMFDAVTPAAPDAILGLTEAYNNDDRPGKVNLGVGVYKDASGKTPVLASVKEAERRLIDAEATKSYKPIDGDPAYGACVQGLLFGAESSIVTGKRAATSHCPGGTGALRVAGDYLHANHPGATLWLSDETWPNHPAIFQAAGLEMKRYPYFDARANALDFGAMLEGLSKASAGDVVLLHGCCHNPTGVDMSAEQWVKVAELCAEKKLLPLLDFAYQGFAEGIEQDAAGLRALTAKVSELIVCGSFSKNFGLYNERVGSLTFVAGSADSVKAVQSQVKTCVRRNYSNPPAHGGAVVTTILNDAALAAQWRGELGEMRDRINAVRSLFVSTLADKGAGRDFSFITRQRGMFSYSGLNKDQVAQLRDKHAVYIVGSGRINVAGMTEANMDALCEAIVDVL
jgi:aspartate/tyrosine/aromatic aminotransferase